MALNTCVYRSFSRYNINSNRYVKIVKNTTIANKSNLVFCIKQYKILIIRVYETEISK